MRKDWKKTGYLIWSNKKKNKHIEIVRFTKKYKELPQGWYGISLYTEKEFKPLNMTQTKLQAIDYAKNWMEHH